MKKVLGTLIALLLLSDLSSKNCIAQEVNWRRIGNFNDVHWLATAANGHMFIIAVDSVYRTKDEGATWSRLNTGLEGDAAIHCIATTTNGGIYIGGDSAVVRSTDDGDTWTSVFTDVSLGTIAADSVGYVYVACGNGGLRRSSDNGATWQLIMSGYVYTVVLGRPGEVIAEGGNNAWRSMNSGASWELYGLGVTMLEYNSKGMAFASNSVGDVFSRRGYAPHLFRSTDSGGTWTVLNNLDVRSLLIDRHDQIFMGCRSGGILTSTDDGTNWTTLNPGLVGDAVYALTMNSKGVIFAGTEEGLFRNLNTVPLPPIKSDFYVNPAGQDSNSGNTPASALKSIADALSRIAADSANPHIVHIAKGVYGKNETGEAKTLRLKSYVSLAGESEDEVTLSDTRMNMQSVARVTIEQMTVRGVISVDQCNPTLKHLKLKATHGSEGPGIYLYSASSPFMQDIDISGANGEAGILMYGSSPTLRNITIHDNYGWLCGGIRIEENSNPILVNATIASNSGGEIGGVHANAGSHPILVNTVVWNNSQPEVELRAFTNWNCTITFTHCDIQGGQGKIHIANYDTGIGSVDWLEGNMDQDPLFVDMKSGDLRLQQGSPCIDAGTPLFIVQGDTLVNLKSDQYVGPAPDMGAFEYGKLTGIQAGSMTPQTYSLSQNYPNPFNPSTTIRYGLPHKSAVQLTVFNTLGQQVATLIQGEQEAGYHEVRFDASALSSGVYFYRLQAGTFVETRKLLLLR